MYELFDVILDALCDFLGIENRKGEGPGILRWFFRVLFGIFMVLFSILMTILSLFRIRRPRKRLWRWIWLIVLLFVMIAVAVFLLMHFSVI